MAAEESVANQLHLIFGIPDYIVYGLLALVIGWFLVKGLMKLMTVAIWLGVAYFIWRNWGALSGMVVETVSGWLSTANDWLENFAAQSTTGILPGLIGWFKTLVTRLIEMLEG